MKKIIKFLLMLLGLFLLVRYWKYGRFICMGSGVLLALQTVRTFFSAGNRQEVMGRVHLPELKHHPKDLFDKLRHEDEAEEEDEEDEDGPLFIREYIVPDGLDQSGTEDFTAKNVLSTKYDADFHRFES